MSPAKVVPYKKQKKVGATRCRTCKYLYEKKDLYEEMLHESFHNAAGIFKFSGWKDERVGALSSYSKIIIVRPSDPAAWIQKVKNLMKVVSKDIGYAELHVPLVANSQVYLHITNGKIVGCLVARPKSTAYRMLPDDIGIDMCSQESYPVKCGISHLWVAQPLRHKGIGTSLVDCLRRKFISRSFLSNDDIALSSPTAAGKAFARKYFKTRRFLVYFI